jgi:hypothetical protein
MNRFVDKDKYNEVLEQYKGAYAQIWTFHITLKRLVIRLSFPKQRNELFILGAGVMFMNGPFSWEQSNIIIEDELIDDKLVPYSRILDSSSSFELTAYGGFVLMDSDSEAIWYTLDEFRID